MIFSLKIKIGFIIETRHECFAGNTLLVNFMRIFEIITSEDMAYFSDIMFDKHVRVALG